ncbi:MAG TPA: S-layer homology domain-containing protein [Spirochaetia bacterium]|nr:S-layer homology domain-containing protein [Spirochaetia bacterium]
MAQTGPVFTDTRGNWAQGHIPTVAAYGIVSGFDSSHFGPNDLVTREQITAMVVRVAKLAPVTGELFFEDAGRIDPRAREDVITAVKDGIINGYPDGTFRPFANANRAEAVTVVAGILK